jgi:hypothetical protein
MTANVVVPMAPRSQRVERCGLREQRDGAAEGENHKTQHEPAVAEMKQPEQRLAQGRKTAPACATRALRESPGRR